MSTSTPITSISTSTNTPDPSTIGDSGIAMDTPTVEPADDTISISELACDGSWDGDSEASTEDGDASEADPMADEAYWEEDAAAVEWLARYPGGTPLLYPQLFVVKPRRGEVVTPSRHPNLPSYLLSLPSEIRNRIYRHCFDWDEEVKRPKEGYYVFRDREGIEMRRINLTTQNQDLKFGLSTALLQTSRQLRFEAMPILFSNRVITVEWLPALPRLVEFLGKQGCAMLRYLDIWDTLNLKGGHGAIYRDIIASIMHLPGLLHLRIILICEISPRSIGSWFNVNERMHDGTLRENAVPKMRSEDIERHWPEYEVLKKLRARKFTLAMEIRDNGYLEFCRHHGAYPELCKSIQSLSAPTKSEISPISITTSSISPQVLEAFKAIEIPTHGCAFAPSVESDDEDSDSPTWQDTDNLANKTIPLYNFIRKFFHNNISIESLRRERPLDNFVHFPTARKSTGSIMRDCAMCYLYNGHCGYHALPDQPPFEPKPRQDLGTAENAKTLDTRFESMAYVDMREACRDVAQWMTEFSTMDNDDTYELFQAFAIFDYLRWFETPNIERLALLDGAVDVGWMGNKVDKDEVPPWDVLYREIRSRHGNHSN